MIRLFVLTILLFIGISLIAQEKSEDCSWYLNYGDRTENEVKNYLNKQIGYIRLRFPYCYNISKDSLFLEIFSDKIKSDKDFYKNIHREVDSILIELDNGLSWNLSSQLPQKPKRLYLRIFSKKERESQDIIDWIKYLKFCSQFKSSSSCKVIDNYIIYTHIRYKENKVLNAVYYTDRGNKICDLLELKENKEISTDE